MNFNIKTFYILGSIAMAIVVLGNIVNLVLIWQGITIGAKVSTIASTAFSCLLAALFFNLYKNTPDVAINNKELDELVSELRKK